MSMISGQCDELRDTADKLDKISAVSTPWIHHNLTPMMRDAADTIWQLRDDLQRANAAVQDAEHDESMAWDRVRKAEAENVKLREQMERLVTLLRVDCDIEASWDGLRKFWSIGLTDGGCLMRDRVCKGEAENAKLRELCKRVLKNCYDAYEQVWGWDDDWVILCDEARELGVEVDE